MKLNQYAMTFVLGLAQIATITMLGALFILVNAQAKFPESFFYVGLIEGFQIGYTLVFVGLFVLQFLNIDIRSILFPENIKDNK